MFTAKDMHDKLQQLNVCKGIDEWIETTLYDAFVKSNSAWISSYQIDRNDWTKNGFISEMSSRGFSVEYVSDQRDGDNYRITFPPQER